MPESVERKQTGGVPAGSEEWFGALVRNASDIVTLYEADGTIRYVSPAIKRVLGYDPEERIGTDSFELIHPDDVARAKAAFAQALRRPDVPLTIEVRVRHRDGSWRHVEATGTNLLDDPDVGAIVLNSRDITERRRAYDRLAESERRFATVISNARAYVYRCLNEPGWSNEFVSDYALELTGYPPEDLLVGGKVRFGDLIVEEDRQRVWEEVQAALVRRERFELRYKIRRRDGALRYVEEFGQGVFDENGNVEALEGLAYDVTERERTRQMLAEERNLLRTLIDNLPDHIFVKDTESRFVISNAGHLRVLGAAGQDEVVGKTDFDFSPQELAARYYADEQEIIASGRPLIGKEEPAVDQLGKSRWRSTTKVPLRDEQGNIVGLVGMSRDITERKRQEEALRESEERFRSTFDKSAIGMAVSGLDGRFIQVNRSLCDLLGYSEEELLATTFLAITHPDDLGEDLDHTRRMLDGEFDSFQMEKRYLHADGHVVWISLSVSLVRDPEGHPLHLVSQIQDITERKRSEERLRRAEARYRALVERMPAVVYVQEIGSPDSAMYMSPQIEALTGYSVEECKDPALRWGMVHPEDRERLRSEEERELKPSEVFATEYRVLHREGRIVWVRNESVMVEDEASGSRYWQGFMLDVTERKRAQEALKESELRLRTVVANVPVILFALDRAGVFNLSEGKGLEALGLKPGEVVGRSVFEVYREVPQILADVRRALSGETFSAITEMAGLVFETWYSPVLGEDGEVAGVIGVAADVTEQERLEEELREANRRMEKLAVLKADFTAMVAHEIDAPLAVIRMFTEVLSVGELEPAERDRALDTIRAEVGVLDSLIADLRLAASIERDDFSVNPQRIAVAELLEDAAAYARTLPGDHPLVVEGTEGRVWADPFRIGQVLRNLLSNAAKYSPAGLPIELRARPVSKANGTPERVRIEVADHGPGIHPDDVTRIFEKFGRGRDRFGRRKPGVGLGLYASRRILRTHGSELELDSTPGAGTVFGFELENRR
jgi:PAS domain S-box-containing protein